MSVVRFNGDGDLIVESGIQSVKVTLNISWSDDIGTDGLSLKKLSLNADSGAESWERSNENDTGSASRTFTLSSSASSNKTYNVVYKTLQFNFPSVTYTETNANPIKNNDTRIIFKDNDGDDANATITLSTADVKRFETQPTQPPTGGGNTVIDAVGDCPPGPWSFPPPTSCGVGPNLLSSNDGLQIRRTGTFEIALNLKNYANKLVTLKVTHQRGDASWTQGFGFNVPNCSDISPDTGGTPYAKNGYYNSDMRGTTIFYLYNVDGGDYDIPFFHESSVGPAPWRQLYTKQSETSPPDAEGNTTTTYYCAESGTEVFSPWPYCYKGVALSKNGGNEVQWQYEDGGDGDYNDQYVTVQVVSVRNAIGFTGSVCTSALKNSIWFKDPLDALANGNCISDYKDHSQKIRFRIPALKTSKASFNLPVCYSDFRGIAGAVSPTEQQGSITPEYSVLHVFNRDFKTTVSLTSSLGITVTPKSENDSFVSPYNEATPGTNTNLGIVARKHYEVVFNDTTTTISNNADNITFSIGQSVTADGLNAAPIFFKKQKVDDKTLRVWFYLNYRQNQQQTDDIIHVFDDTTNTTNTELSKFSPTTITIVPQSLTDPGNGTSGYTTLNALNKKHYIVTFLESDSTIVNADASNIIFEINKNMTASGDVYRIDLSKRERINDKSLRVWFTSYNPGNPVGLELDNTFVNDFSINRTRVENFSGNVFPRSWYLTKSV